MTNEQLEKAQTIRNRIRRLQESVDLMGKGPIKITIKYHNNFNGTIEMDCDQLPIAKDFAESIRLRAKEEVEQLQKEFDAL